MISLSGLDIEEVWKIVKNYRLKYLIKNVDTIPTSSYKCFTNTKSVYVLDLVNTHSTLDAIEEELKKIRSQSQPIKDDVNEFENKIDSEFYEKAG